MTDGQKINLWVLHVLCSPTNYAGVWVACKAQTHFRPSLLSLRKIRRERSDDRKCVCASQARVWGAYSTKFYLPRFCSKVQSAVKCENAKQFYEKEFLEGMWGPCVYDCLIQLLISPAKTTIFTFLEVILIHCIYSSSYPKKKQRKDPAKS